MQIIFVIFGLIVLISFITGVILNVSDKKKNSVENLTDDPKTLFEESSSLNTISSTVDEGTPKEYDTLSVNSIIADSKVTNFSPDEMITVPSESKQVYVDGKDNNQLVQKTPVSNAVNLDNSFLENKVIESNVVTYNLESNTEEII